MEFISDAVEDIAGHPANDFISNRVRSFVSVIGARALASQDTHNGGLCRW
jgi:hypothetical protein